ncbi:MAG: hypothetical protein ACYC91_09030 [Solirubrobacteraceae bacterium]
MVGAVALAAPSFAGAAPTLVSSGSPPSPFAQNKQNEPGVAVDEAHPQYVAAGSNDEIDLEACNAGDPTTCPFTQGVGVSGVYLSDNGGSTFTQPTYQGYTARHCLGPVACQPHQGPIGTLPGYYQAGLVSDGDPILAFGPEPDGNGGFSYAQGSRLYYVNLASNFATQRSEQGFKGFEAIAVSRLDTQDFRAARAGDNQAWKAPVLVSQQNAALFSDKDAVWADNAQSSAHFGNVYVCNTAFRSQEKGHGVPEPILFYRSTDGGGTFSTPVQLSSATSNSQNPGRQSCTIRTDSFPSVDIANGAGAAPTSDATDEIVLTYCNGPTPSNTQSGPNEQAVVLDSLDHGQTFSDAGSASAAGDRPDFPAIAISPDGQDVYLTYTNFLQRWQSSALSPPRLAQGVVREASVGTGGTPGLFADIYRGPAGDARGSSQNGLTAGFLGDYNYLAATRTVGIATFNDVRNATDCPAIDAYRQNLIDGTTPNPTPAPNTVCPATFGNSDIYGGAFLP